MCHSVPVCRMFLCLFSGGAPKQLPKGLGTEEKQSSSSASFVQARWVLHVIQASYFDFKGINSIVKVALYEFFCNATLPVRGLISFSLLYALYRVN